MHRDTGQDLHIKGPQTNAAFGRLSYQGIGLDQQIVDRFSFRCSLDEGCGFASQVVIRCVNEIDCRDFGEVLLIGCEVPLNGNVSQLVPEMLQTVRIETTHRGF